MQYNRLEPIIVFTPSPSQLDLIHKSGKTVLVSIKSNLVDLAGLRIDSHNLVDNIPPSWILGMIFIFRYQGLLRTNRQLANNPVWDVWGAIL